MRKALGFLAQYRVYLFAASQLCVLALCDHWSVKWILLVASLATIAICALFDAWLKESHERTREVLYKWEKSIPEWDKLLGYWQRKYFEATGSAQNKDSWHTLN